MSAIESLLKVMTLRDAEAMILEPGKIPSLRRRGQIEALAMPALDAEMLAAFAEPMTSDKTEWPAMVPFTDGDGAHYAVTIDKLASGYKLVVRRSKPASPRPMAAPPPPASTPPPPPSIAHEVVVEAVAPAAGGALDRMARLLSASLAIARSRDASDITLSTGQAPRIRAQGRIEPLDVHIDDAELAACVAAVRRDGRDADLSLEIDGVRLRINAFVHLNGSAIAARLIREHVPSLVDLALPPELGAIVDLRDGLVVVCGPTGSGKSTTLAALVDLLDQRRAAHVITLEDPIEYRFAARRCLIHQRELGTHVPSFADGLRAALREAPDVILLGELRDRDTLAAALTAAETGHLVLATLHAPNAAGAIDRVIDAFPDAQQRQIRWQLAAVLRTVVTQFLLPRKDGGRAAAVELVPVTTAVANIIRKGDLHTLPTAIQSGREAGMIPLERSLARLIDSGTVSAQAVKKIAADHDLLASLSRLGMR
jgi:twitching motility protein PilT